MELVIILIGVALLDAAALRWGINSRDSRVTREL